MGVIIVFSYSSEHRVRVCLYNISLFTCLTSFCVMIVALDTHL